MEENIHLTLNYLEPELILQFLWQVSLVIRALAMSLSQQSSHRSISLKANVSLRGWRYLCLRAEAEPGRIYLCSETLLFFLSSPSSQRDDKNKDINSRRKNNGFALLRDYILRFWLAFIVSAADWKKFF